LVTDSLTNNTTGCQNTALGQTAGSTVTTGSNLTLLGYNAEPSSATATNEVTLGDTNVTIVRNQGSILFPQSSRGIYLGTTTATASNLLDDYEEGTWTPTLNASDTGTLSGNAGYYVKIGSMVFITCVGDKSGGSNNLLEGLPFTVFDYGANFNATAINARKSDSKVTTDASEINKLKMLVQSTNASDNTASFGFSLTYYTNA
jgi:hypothetical protein